MNGEIRFPGGVCRPGAGIDEGDINSSWMVRDSGFFASEDSISSIIVDDLSYFGDNALCYFLPPLVSEVFRRPDDVSFDGILSLVSLFHGIMSGEIPVLDVGLKNDVAGWSSQLADMIKNDCFEELAGDCDNKNYIMSKLGAGNIR
jgi:hypothetical protein